MFTITIKALLRVVYTLGCVGLVLGCIAVIDAFQKLPETEDHILVVAIVIVVVTLAAVLTYTRRLLHNNG